MPTTTLTARCNARPSRLAFVLPTPDREALFTVIARATSLWGGIYNPIIILDGSTRVVHGFQEEHSSGGDYLRSQEAVLRAFDPDFLFTFSPDPLPDQLKVFQHRTYPAAQLESTSYHNQIVSAFVDIWPVLDDFWEQEFKFSSKPPIKVRYPEKSEAEKSLLIAAHFGLYANDDSYEFLRERFSATSFTYDAAFKSDMVSAGVLSPNQGITTGVQPRQTVA